MDDDDAARGSDAVVVGANWYRFGAGERIRHERVLSVCGIWVLGGSGAITSRGRTVRMQPGAVLLLPWAHDVGYDPDDRSPFRLGTVHVVPHHDRSEPVEPRVAHLPGDPLLESTVRSGGEVSAARDHGPVLVPTGSDAARRIAQLGGYVVDRFAEDRFDESVFRALGAVLLDEFQAVRAALAAAPASGAAPPGSVALDAMTAFVARNLGRPLTVREIADAGGCSPATAERLFARHTGSAVSAWVRDARIREAATLLRTSGLRVAEVARAVGYDDPLYFSRVFRRTIGVPPSRYAADRMRP